MFYWKINQKAITEKYCENKARPELECNGQCHLKKQLKAFSQEDQKQGKSDSTIPIKKDVKLEKVEYTTSNFDFHLTTNNFIIHHKPYDNYCHSYKFNLKKPIFQPPIV